MLWLCWLSGTKGMRIAGPSTNSSTRSAPPRMVLVLTAICSGRPRLLSQLTLLPPAQRGLQRKEFLMSMLSLVLPVIWLIKSIWSGLRIVPRSILLPYRLRSSLLVCIMLQPGKGLLSFQNIKAKAKRSGLLIGYRLRDPKAFGSSRSRWMGSLAQILAWGKCPAVPRSRCWPGDGWSSRVMRLR